MNLAAAGSLKSSSDWKGCKKSSDEETGVLSTVPVAEWAQERVFFPLTFSRRVPLFGEYSSIEQENPAMPFYWK